MHNNRIDQVIAAAISAGILPAGARPPAEEERPWPVILMTALGAWLAAIPLLIVVFTMFSGLLAEAGPGAMAIGLLMVVASTMLLRVGKLSLFVEQLAVPALLAGMVTLGTGLVRNGAYGIALAQLAIVALLCAVFIPRNWLRTLLGAMACMLAVSSVGFDAGKRRYDAWLMLHLAVGAWLAVQWVAAAKHRSQSAATVAAIEAGGRGWVLATLAGLAISSGMTFLAGASLGGGGENGMRGAAMWDEPLHHTGSVAMAIAAATWAGLHWPSLRQPWSGLVATVLAALAFVMPSLGAVLLLLAVFAVAQRWRLAIAAGSAAVWIVGAFYYQLSIPLADKAIMMFVAGCVLAAIAWLTLKHRPANLPHAEHAPDTRAAKIGIALTAAAVLAVANIGIWQKQTLIAEGKPVFLELAPVDPRSLMQGDYMQLDFKLLRDLQATHRDDLSPNTMRVLAKLDPHGIATLARTDAGQPVADEAVIELKRKGGAWSLGTDAWYFKEGEGGRWARAKYGEFRVDANGHVLLVGLRGPNLEPL